MICAVVFLSELRTYGNLRVLRRIVAIGHSGFFKMNNPKTQNAMNDKTCAQARTRGFLAASRASHNSQRERSAPS
jgi:hypothetical protein